MRVHFMSIGIATWISLLMAGVSGVVAYRWLQKENEESVTSILAPRRIEEALPVYAQFTVTQVLEIKKATEISRLAIPFYLPGPSSPIQIDMRQNGKLLQRWRYPRPEENIPAGVQVASFAVLPNQVIAGQLEIQFIGTAIDNDHRDQAPRLFVESADDAYPFGHYRIAQNDKRGDVSLELFTQVTRWQNLSQTMHRQPLVVFSQVGKGLFLLIVLMAIPHVLFRLAWPQYDRERA